MSDAEQRVVIVGGGVIGAACAYYLRQAGRAVTIIDQGTFGGGCSHGNCGYVSPSHVLPLASPGALRRVLKTLWADNSPLIVRWRFDPAMWRWFWRFAKRCNTKDMMYAGHAIQALLQSSRAQYDELLSTTLTDVDWQTQGLLFVFRTQQGMYHHADTQRGLRKDFGIDATRYDGRALTDLEPALQSGIAGGWLYEIDAHLQPARLMAAWRRSLTQMGVEIRENCKLKDLTVDRRLARRLVTTQGDIEADQIVIATGAWTPKLNELLRKPIPIEPGKGYSITMPRPTICPRFPMLFEEHRVAITPFADSYRIGSTMEFAGYDDSLNPQRLQLLRDGAAIYLREPTAEPVLESWFGWRPMTPDGLPLIGRVPAFDNVYLSAGHSMLGVSMAPGTGRLLAEIVTGELPHLDPHPYAVTRM